MSLNTLKERLQTVLNESTESEDFKEALSDAMYGCSLSEAALNTLFFAWSNEELHLEKLSEGDKEYQRGIEFVEQEWHKITGMF